MTNFNFKKVLCPNHNHFLLFDDDSEDKFKKTIEFRTKFEDKLRQGLDFTHYNSSSVSKVNDEGKYMINRNFKSFHFKKFRK